VLNGKVLARFQDREGGESSALLIQTAVECERDELTCIFVYVLTVVALRGPLRS
jgi:hypothetical protein